MDSGRRRDKECSSSRLSVVYKHDLQVCRQLCLLLFFLSLSAQYFATTMFIVGLSVIATVLVLQYHHHDPNGSKMPKWVSLTAISSFCHPFFISAGHNHSQVAVTTGSLNRQPVTLTFIQCPGVSTSWEKIVPDPVHLK